MASLLIMLLSSCSTMSEEEIASPFIEEGTRFSGEEAAAVYERGLEETDSVSLYYNLAYSYLESGDYDKAIATADKAIEIYPDYLRFRYLKAYAERSCLRFYSYEKTLKEILEYDPGNSTIRELLLEHYMTIGRKADAADVAREIIIRDPENQEAIKALASESSFFLAIAPEDSISQKEKARLWTEPPFVYMPIGILNGDRILSQPTSSASSTP